MQEAQSIDPQRLRDGFAVYMIGAGGAGMSAIATVLIEMGCKVEGSDLKDSSYVRRLRDLGAAIGLGHRARNLGDCQVVVKSSAIRHDNPEVQEAQRRGIPIISRAQMLATIMAGRKGIAVAGTHGKTTTTAIVACVLKECGVDPSYLIGGELKEIGGNAHYGKGEFVVAEADESDGSLLCLRPEIAVLTNVDWDHTDYFDSLDGTATVFREFLDLLSREGFAVICGDDPTARGVGESFRASGRNVIFYGQAPDNNYRFEITSARAEGSAFRVMLGEEKLLDVTTRLPGVYNAYNSTAAFAVAHRLGFDLDDIARGMENCRGVRRRFELIGERSGVTVIDDYAHHPTEVKAVLDMAREITSGRVVVVFQPHRYSRTRMLHRLFGESFDGAGLVVVTDIFSAGEDPEPGVTGNLIADSICERDSSRDVVYIESRSELARGVVNMLEPGDVVITMGAGDITRCAREILDLLPEGEG